MIRLGTRGSALAMAQARMTAEALGGEVEIVEITTTGDRDRALPEMEPGALVAFLIWLRWLPQPQAAPRTA